MTDHSGPAFPCAEIRGPNGEGICESAPGMSMRDWFAGQAFVSAFEQAGKTSEGDLDRMFGKGEVNIGRAAIAAALAYRYADEMLARRNQK